jgi:hypothetical protein
VVGFPRVGDGLHHVMWASSIRTNREASYALRLEVVSVTLIVGVGAVLIGVAALVTASPLGVKAYIDLRTFHDKRKKKIQVREISTVSPKTGTITKRSA